MPDARAEATHRASPLLIFIHGGFCDRHDWDGVIDTLRPRYEGLSFDLPGHGGAAPAGEASIGSFADALTAIRTSQGDRPVILIAHSAGCRVALESFHRNPENVIGIVLADAGQRLGEGDPAEAVRAFSSTLDAIGFTNLMRAGFEQATASANEDDRARILARVLAHDGTFGRDFLLSVVAWDADRAAMVFARVNVPLLIVEAIGATDPQAATPSPWSELALANAPLAQLRYLQGGHFLMLEQTQKLCELVDGFAMPLVTRAPASTP